jgi:hypothetical protein
MPSLSPALVAPALGGEPPAAGGRRRGVPVKTLKKVLKAAGLKTTGKKAALTRRAKKAHLKMRGGVGEEGEETDVAKALDAAPEFEDGGRRRRRSRKGLVSSVTGLAKGALGSVGYVGRKVFGRGSRKH